MLSVCFHHMQACSFHSLLRYIVCPVFSVPPQISPDFQLNRDLFIDYCSFAHTLWSSGGNRRSRANALSHTLFSTKISPLHRLSQHPTAWILSHQNLPSQRRSSNRSYLCQYLKERLDSHHLTVARVDSDSLSSHRSIPGE